HTISAPSYFYPLSLHDALPILLRAQQPIGGMSGQVNQTVVRQFRMPGYPFILTTTDLLQEGEDLHLFCSDVYHYGIAWMPSSMRSEEHTSELQSRSDLVCRLLL